MGLLQQWRDTAYSQQTDKKVLQKFWTDYFMIEKGIYEKLLSEPDVKVKGTVKELAAKYEIPVMTMVGFLDGIDESLIVPNPIEEMDEDTEVNLIFDKEKRITENTTLSMESVQWMAQRINSLLEYMRYRYALLVINIFIHRRNDL